MILHIATREDYDKYLNSPNKEYCPARFAKDGFIHCSNESQVSGVANFMFKGRKDLVLLLIDEERVRECLKYEDPGSGNLFPHVYRTFFEDDIKEVSDFLPDANGEFNFQRISVKGIVIKDNKILLMHRVNEGKEYYVFPGGGQEEGESLEQTVVRELQEETSIQIKPIKILYHITWDPESQNYFYLCEYISGGPKLSVDSEEYAEMRLGKQKYEPMWVDISKLPELLVYQLEIRDLLTEDLKTGFSDKVKELKIKVSERRENI